MVSVTEFKLKEFSVKSILGILFTNTIIRQNRFPELISTFSISYGTVF